ncbi:hypothetical protein HPB49_009228 [Dermacentor silvarum]|uniref:Uncharacterized protein n=1 Tax=Dermacentor silvarum TaxID=543639 RepID=A0ACB8C8H4_DERSI|nr:hypothetical protein HPB49_009228 [Dermacentor silvarum]
MEHYKIILRSRGDFRVSDYTSNHIVQCIVKAASLPEEAQEQDTICINYQQNTMVISTPIEEHADKYKKIVCIRTNTQEYEASAYEAAPDNASKEVFRGIGLEDSGQEIRSRPPLPRTVWLLHVRRRFSPEGRCRLSRAALGLAKREEGLKPQPDVHVGKRQHALRSLDVTSRPIEREGAHPNDARVAAAMLTTKRVERRTQSTQLHGLACTPREESFRKSRWFAVVTS